MLSTKFHIPHWPAAAVHRPHLMSKLSSGLEEHHKLTLVSAPAGYGKTTLIAGWLHVLKDSRVQAAWLSLDAAENDLTRFFTYWLAGFQRVNPFLNTRLQGLMNLPQFPAANVLLDELINILAVHDTPVLLTLDDYHVITNSQIHDALAYFIDNQPAGVHLVITTREDPPLPLARLRARGQMTEIRAHDLRFSPEESRQFFNQSQNQVLTEKTLQALDERTEGWAAGLQLAALALEHQTNPAAFVDTFRGSHRYVLDYLAEEVIRQQAEEVKQFLVQTSILTRFNREVCEALTGHPNAQSIIAFLEQANLFIVPLDDERVWYRYHHLFSDYLRLLLTQAQQSQLYKKASLWHESQKLLVEAVHYALASNDQEFAADVIQRALSINTTWSLGNITLLSAWLDALPRQALESRPQLSLDASRILFTLGRFELAEKCIEQAEYSINKMPVTPENEQLPALAALYRGSIAAVRGNFYKAIEYIKFAQAHLSPENHLAQARAFYSLGQANFGIGQTERASQNYLQSSDEAKKAGVLYLVVHARCAAARMQIAQGRLSQAEQTCRQAIDHGGSAQLPLSGLAWTLLGSIALERNNLAMAEQYLTDGIKLSRQGNLMDDLTWGLIFMGRLRAVQGDSVGALTAAQEVDSIVRAYGVPRMSLLASAYLARIQHDTGQTQAAALWATQYQTTRQELSIEYAELTLAHILLELGQLQTLPAILEPLLESADQAGRIQSSIEILLLMGLFHHANGDLASGLDYLGKSLALAAPEGYTRVFLNEFDSLSNLLPRVRGAAPDLVKTLLGTSSAGNDTRLSPMALLPDPLSEQEIRVLDLIVAGKSNQEIARELFISVGTAKWHVHNVFQKLGVNNRPQAIARAREIGL